MRTGQVAEELGLYSTECCTAELIFGVGDTFARCPQCQNNCEWELECELMTIQDFENLNGGIAA